MLTKYERNRIQEFYGQAAADIFEYYAKLKTDHSAHSANNSAPERAVKNNNIDSCVIDRGVESCD